MRVLVVGGGGREHALVWKLHFSPQVTAIYCVPGNAGISLMAHEAPVAPDDVRGLVKFAIANAIELTVVGPEAPLAAGIVDAFQDAQLRIFGPTQAAARIESSKVWAKDLMQRYRIPTARWTTADSPEDAREQARVFGAPVVLKADGLAGGKGAVVCRTIEEADQVIEEFIVRGVHGDAGRRLVIEEFLEGPELSVFALADGQSVLPLISARDYKPLLDGNLGPNTGGMGGYTGPSYATPVLLDEVRRTVLEPTVAAMAAEGAPFVGVLYAGLMLTRNGPMVLEFNCRWGDPEAQLIMPLLQSDLVELMNACIDGRLDQARVEWHDGVSCGVVLASPGYPAAPVTGTKITGLDDLDEGVLAFHAATRLLRTPEPARGFLRRGVRRTTEADIGMVTDGGRVLTFVATGPTLAAARGKIYANINKVHFDGIQFRRDIGIDDAMTMAGGTRRLAEPGPDEVPTSTVASSAPNEPLVPDVDPDVTRFQTLPLEDPLAPDSGPPAVAVLMGSESDRPIMDETVKALNALGIAHEVHVMSAHRTPERVREFSRGAEARGIRVIIGGAGGAAHLPGVIAAQTTLPVIGVPIAGSSMMGLDSLLSIVQMPGGVPVATVAVGTAGARNAAYLAATIIGQTDPGVRARYRAFRNEQSGGELGLDQG